MMTRRILRALALLLLLGMAFPGCDKSTESEPFAPAVLSTPILTATVGQAYTYDVAATADPAPTFTLDQAPQGMTINQSTGEITWTPASDSPFEVPVSVVVTNSVGSVTHDFIIQVAGLQIEGWETGSLINEDIDPDAIRSVAAAISAGTYPQISSLIIIRNGRLVFEEYFNNASRNTAMNIYSAEKSITSCLVGIAIDEGFIASVYEPLYSFFPEYDSIANWSDWKDDITLRHLITMTAGFSLEGDDYDLWLNNIGPRDWIKFYLDLPVTFLPGTGFDYTSLCDRLAGHVVEREAQTTLPSFAVEHLFQPLGMTGYNWSAWDPVNNSMISSGLRLRAIDMAKFGQMYLDDGVWQGTRIVSENWVGFSTMPFRGDYGYNWWVHDWATPVGSAHVYYAFGNGGNSIFVLDDLQLVVVFTGNYFVDPDTWDNQYGLMQNEIIPAACDSL